MQWVGVAEAADVLGVDGRQVRHLLAAGDLAGRRLGRVWLVDAESVRARRRQPRSPGRPLGSAKAWAVLEVVGHHLTEGPASPSSQPPPGAVGVRNVPSVDRWPSWLRGRGPHARLYLHPGLMDRFDEVHRSVASTPLGRFARARRTSRVSCEPTSSRRSSTGITPNATRMARSTCWSCRPLRSLPATRRSPLPPSSTSWRPPTPEIPTLPARRSSGLPPAIACARRAADRPLLGASDRPCDGRTHPVRGQRRFAPRSDGAMRRPRLAIDGTGLA